MTLPPQQIVKLIPYGARESGLFVIETVGGTDAPAALVDFVGWHIQPFPGLTTDINGKVSVTLAHTPSTLAQCFCISSDDARVLAPVALAGKILTIQKRKLVYDRVKTPLDASSVVNPPAGVSVAAASGATTEDATATNQSVTLPGGALTTPGAASAYAGGAHNHDQDPHAHATNVLYQHGHTVAYDLDKVLAIAASEATNLMVLYK